MTFWRKNRMMLKLWRAERELRFRELGIVRTLDDMTDKEKRALEEKYGCKIKEKTDADSRGSAPPGETATEPDGETG